VSFRQRRCGACQGLFYLCEGCDRGHRYCSEACRGQQRTLSQRKARRKHQRSPQGSLDHRDRQRDYRAELHKRHRV